LLREELVEGEFRASVPGQRQEQSSRQPVDLADQGLDDATAVLAGDLHEQEIPGASLDERCHMRVSAPGDQVSFPVSRRGPSGDLGWSIMNGDCIDDLPAPLALGTGVLPLSHLAPRPEALNELAVKNASGLKVEASIDRLVTDPHLGPAAVFLRQPTSNLFRRPVVL